jgi:hypothetical protein
MLIRIVAAGACIFVLMLVIKDGRVLRIAHLTGSCSVVQVYQDSTELAACRAGKLEGRPDLSRRGCRSVSIVGRDEYWRCAAGFDISDLGR